ncbi:MAG: restriction endonuclease subunit S, partial [Saezia sp.]
MIPEGWAKTTVGSYLHLKNGFAFKSGWYTEQDETTVPVIRISDIDGKYASASKAAHVSNNNAAEGFEIKDGDLLIAMSGATTGKVGVYTSNKLAYQNQRVGNLRLNSEINGSASYRNYLISNLTPDILKIAYGGAQPNISGKAIEDMAIILPPLAEQKVIADKLDELLAQVESTKVRLDAIPAILKSFRQSVLTAAVSGKLIPSEGSRVATVGKVAQDIRYGTSKKCYYNGGATPVIRIPNIGNRKLDISDLKSANFTDNELDKLALQEGDLLVIRSNGSVELVAK